VSNRALFFVACLILVATSASSEWGEPVNLGPNINSDYFEYFPCISSDGTTLYYTAADRPGGFGGDDIWISIWNGAEWGVPANAGPNVNWESRDLSPSISADGTELYFVSWGRPGGYGAYDIWVSTWEDTMWGPAVNLGPNVNTPYMEWNVSISHDGTKLYISSDRPGGYEDLDIWVSEWDGGQWCPPTNLGPNVNTFAGEETPCVSTDGKTLYFARWMFASEKLDIYVSEWADTAWGPAVNLGPPINTATWDNGPSISGDGMRLYFASGPDTNDPAVQDIWVSEWVPGVQEEEAPRTRSIEGAFLTCLPNPFSSTTVIRFSVPEPGHISLRIYDVAGRLVRGLPDGIRETGSHEVFWDGRDDRGESLPSGVYFCRLEAGRHSATGKLHLVR
jgi:Tol biopolymer transport system component